MSEYMRKPTSPGEILLEEFLKPLGISQRKFADHLGCDYKVINRIVNEKAAVTPNGSEASSSFRNDTGILAQCANGARPMATSSA